MHLRGSTIGKVMMCPSAASKLFEPFVQQIRVHRDDHAIHQTRVAWRRPGPEARAGQPCRRKRGWSYVGKQSTVDRGQGVM
ncbi:hypothetical protein AOZ06_40745 [Kibdelosporangium phytohabitans]|uniref:Uncharacterized protein n=1 Tax=Kibdelosporangium phytohabitans TaxID=860235 RepID=A0A0N7F4T8_9PSEU|nr:hypothetical protein AOZ06_40745 [Kibdelosporangium phytohabitans]